MSKPRLSAVMSSSPSFAAAASPFFESRDPRTTRISCFPSSRRLQAETTIAASNERDLSIKFSIFHYVPFIPNLFCCSRNLTLKPVLRTLQPGTFGLSRRRRRRPADLLHQRGQASFVGCRHFMISKHHPP